MTEVAEALLNYLRQHTHDDRLQYTQRPEVLAGGFDAAIYWFSLQTADRSLNGRLVLRLFERGRSPAIAQKETAVQNTLAAMGYPAPDVRIAETNPNILSGAFLIMPRLPGHALAAAFERLSREKHGIGWIIATARQIMQETSAVWTDAQTRLHALDPEEFLARLERAGFERDLFSVDAEIARFKGKIPLEDAEMFAPGFAWLEQHKPPQTRRVICHGDLQPLNVLVDNGQLTGVLDWGAAIVAHPAADYGAVIAIMQTAPVPGPAIARPFIRAVMNKLARDHARPYFQHYSSERETLRYFVAFNCMSQLASVAAPRGANMKGGAYRSATGVRNLVACFRRQTGVRLRYSLKP